MVFEYIISAKAISITLKCDRRFVNNFLHIVRTALSHSQPTHKTAYFSINLRYNINFVF